MAAEIENRVKHDQKAAPDQRMAILTSTIVFLTLVIWTVAGGPGVQFDPLRHPRSHEVDRLHAAADAWSWLLCHFRP